MPKGKKRLTQREKAERAAIKKQLQADGVLPPDKPRLNRKKFAREVWEDFSEMDVYTADFYLRKAIMATVPCKTDTRKKVLWYFKIFTFIYYYYAY